MSSFAQLEHYNQTGDTQGGREGTEYEASKRAKRSSARGIDTIPSSVMVNFLNQDGERAGPQVDLPAGSTAKQLELLVNNLLSNPSSLPYAFYINNIEVVGSVTEALHQIELELSKIADTGGEDKRLSYEEAISISYTPLSVFRVRPVTRCIETMPGHTDAVLHISFSPDGKRLASGGGDMAVRFWNTTTHLPTHVCTGHKHHVLCTAWSPDHGSIFVSADRAGEIRMWDAAEGVQLGPVLKGHSKWVTSIAFEPLHLNGQITRFATGSKDHSIKVWNIRTATCLTTICGHSDSVEAIRWAGTGLIYSCSRDRTIKVWAVDGDNVHGSNQHKLVRTLTGHAHRINTLALNCDYVLRTGAISLDSMALSSKQYGKKVSNGDESELETGVQRVHKDLAHRREVRAAAKISSDALNASESKKIQLGTGVDVAATTAAAVSSALQLVSDDVKNARQAIALDRYHSVVGKIPNSGERLVSGSDDFTLIIWSPQESKLPLQRLTGHQQMINHVSFSPDARFFASASFDKKIKIWDGTSGKFLSTCHGHVGAVYQLAWSADSSFLISASKDSTLKLWNAKDGQLKKAMHTLPGHEDEVYALDWSPDGRCVASGSKDRTIKIWHH
jgi:ribosome assembly protein 4